MSIHSAEHRGHVPLIGVAVAVGAVATTGILVLIDINQGGVELERVGSGGGRAVVRITRAGWHGPRPATRPQSTLGNRVLKRAASMSTK